MPAEGVGRKREALRMRTSTFGEDVFFFAFPGTGIPEVPYVQWMSVFSLSHAR